MSTGNQSCLRFSLEESIWFQRGQEVAELISISLDPNITIQENDQYVTIKGSLELNGEYKCEEQEMAEQAEQQATIREVQTVLVREEGVFEFLHRFPVDITIPQNRIESIYDIDITVESFDYDLPTKNSLKLSAELAITGLYGDQQHNGAEEVVVEEREDGVNDHSLHSQLEEAEAESAFRQSVSEEFSLASDETMTEETEVADDESFETPNLYEPFRAEAKKDPQPAGETEAEPALSRQVPSPDEEQPTESEIIDVSPISTLEETKPREDVTLIDFVRQEASEPVQTEGPVIKEKAQLEVVAEEEESSSSSSHDDGKAKGKKVTKKKGLSIAEFLARKEETEVAKLRVCIVQQDDNIQKIADRYEVSVQQLINHNHLGLDQDVTEGQVLYVPVEYAKR
ncbi:stage VI sporulation protein D [Bacillus sp. B15-48]|uniref:stage VI sporulation protein D n=1 Tax=Bacillus sp. B15-48 TaxID=1548601 RepID=UPI00193F6CC4|nr:stage VI sporulation protein D [Bacillus sp. B15-48]MBM4762458.1 stage VI sporulation protein D [Bacillus sp. B15-48]